MDNLTGYSVFCIPPFNFNCFEVCACSMKRKGNLSRLPFINNGNIFYLFIFFHSLFNSFVIFCYYYFYYWLFDLFFVFFNVVGFF